ncbi:BZ3500_MvSof-1268-A1-R1_Chr5-2g07813 [Microbotryum saponariae]|uniref:BZ3500_MvSof-1268-A1-R1_Chr5-2g07813 protein n=1 Tax=Microbotryum saponariae TaxID=289078 RepID=A0A2X0MDY7_9BASI|nr:BZ3500_MvSof-1268-A1-R1_Chr5-2g07813 [Microbotryum saponariae]SDA05682.1 BZ3501_MvSof-1269-A2-R1_Chr5-2g07635 [Microbotryum saponariae]
MSHRSSKTAINLAARAHRRQAPEVRRQPPTTLHSILEDGQTDEIASSETWNTG